MTDTKINLSTKTVVRLRSLSSKDRSGHVIMMRRIGATNLEIANVFGVTESRIKQIFSDKNNKPSAENQEDPNLTEVSWDNEWVRCTESLAKERAKKMISMLSGVR